MRFKYNVTLNVEVEFDAPLLGTDTTKAKRNMTDRIAKAALNELIGYKATSFVKVDREINEDNLTGNVRGEITLRTKNLIDEDKKTI